MGDLRELSTESVNNDKKWKIVVTGYGPFGDHKINASWEAVKKFKDMWIENQLNTEVMTKSFRNYSTHYKILFYTIYQLYVIFVLC